MGQVLGGLLSTARGLAREGRAIASVSGPWPGGLRDSRTPGFYDAPNPIPAGAPGTIIWYEPMTAYLVPGVRLRARALRILYRSTGADGRRTAVSGTLLVPRAGRVRPQPIVAYAPGTHGLVNRAAPSRLLGRGMEWEASVLAMLLARGIAVVMTDYEGLGTPGDHPYIVGRVLGRNVLDALRAARDLTQAGLPDDGPLGVIGYSEGGAAAGWAAELHEGYAPELEIGGIVAGSVPADLERLGAHIEGGPFAFFAGYGAIGLNAAYPDLALDSYLTEEGERHMHALRRTSVIEAAIKGPHFEGVQDMMTEDVLKRPDWQARMRENSLGEVPPSAPVYVHSSMIDPLIPPSVTRDLAERWRAEGADVTYVETPALEHVTGMVLGAPAAIRWLHGRMAEAAVQRTQRTATTRRRRLRAA